MPKYRQLGSLCLWGTLTHWRVLPVDEDGIVACCGGNSENLVGREATTNDSNRSLVSLLEPCSEVERLTEVMRPVLAHGLGRYGAGSWDTYHGTKGVVAHGWRATIELLESCVVHLVSVSVGAR